MNTVDIMRRWPDRETAWSLATRIRAAMAMDEEQRRLFHGIVEVDETCVGGKSRKGDSRLREADESCPPPQARARHEQGAGRRDRRTTRQRCR